jgi:hypothetical protein
MLNTYDKTIARVLFKLLIYKSDGQAFEDIFTSIMDYAEPDFRQIKPWGNIGDRKNDGYIKSKGIFFQVFAPEEIRVKYTEAVSKLNNDFLGLLSQWSPVNEFYFVVNDKYNGVSADAEITINQLITKYKLLNGGIIAAKDLENKLFSLADDQIQTITGNIPDPSRIQLDFNVLNEVIDYILHLSLTQPLPPDIKMPDWDQKILFNQLSKATALRLNNGFLQVNSLQKYLDNNGNFLADTLRDKMNEIYISEKEISSGDELFWSIVKKASPRNEVSFQSAVIVIMAKYFEACDIFERPEEASSDSSN